MEPTTIPDALARLAERPDDPELFQALGRLYVESGRFAEARAAYDRGLELAPHDPWTHLYIGNWCYFRNRLGEALRWFRRAAELLPGDPIAYTCHGDVYRRQGRHDLAEAAYRTAVRVDPGNAYARQKLAEWYALRYGDGGRPGREPRARRPDLITRGRERRTPNARR